MPVDSRVNPRQLDVLKWISEGCPPGRWPPDDYSHILSARALANRGLVTVKGRGPRWSATITDDGKHYLTYGAYPPGHRLEPVRQKRRRETRETIGQPAPVIDSPRQLREKGLAGRTSPSESDQQAHPWDDRILVSVKEAAWLLSLSTHMIYNAVRDGDIDRVFIGEGTTNYRLVYNSLLAWVNSMPTEPVRSW